MKYLSSAILLVAAATASTAFAERGQFYLEGKFGGSREDAKFTSADGYTLDPTHASDNIYVWGGALGYTYKPWILPLRMEAEYLYRNRYNFSSNVTVPIFPVAVTSMHVNTSTLLANFYFDIPATDMLAFFLGAGVGGGFNTAYTTTTEAGFATITSKDQNNGFAYMGTAGFSVMPIKWLALSLSYRYTGLNDITTKAGTDLVSDQVSAQELLLGVRVMIPDLYQAGSQQSRPRSAPPMFDK